VAGGSYLPAQAQEISFMLLRRFTEHVRSRNWTAVGIGFLIILLVPDPAAASVVVHERTNPASRWVHDEFQVFRWDGTRRDIVSWNRDQDLRSSMRNSVVWVYQQIARTIGDDGERRYLQKVGYGNADPSGGVDRFWLDGTLAISAEEQVAFLQRLYRNELPFRIEHQRLVKDVLVVEAGRDWILRAKTGRQGRREPIARAVLRSIGALPPAPGTNQGSMTGIFINGPLGHFVERASGCGTRCDGRDSGRRPRSSC